MKIEVKMIFGHDDIADLLKTEYQKRFAVPVGYELSATDSNYGQWYVELIENEKPDIEEQVTTK